MDEAAWAKSVLRGEVTVNGKHCAPETIVYEHDQVEYYPPETPEPSADLNFRIVYEDRFLAVLDKPGGLCMHPTGPFYRHTLWYQAGLQLGDLHFVSRLDRETSGLTLAAKDGATAAKLSGSLIRKEYLALVFGIFREPVRARGVLVQDPFSCTGKKKHFLFPDAPDDAESGEFADTELEAVRTIRDMTLVRAVLHTGRRHQIRATLFSLGFPLVGDKLYGPDERLYLKLKDQSFTQEDRARLRMDRQALHAEKLIFTHPVTGREIRCESPVDFEKELESCKKRGTVPET